MRKLLFLFLLVTMLCGALSSAIHAQNRREQYEQCTKDQLGAKNVKGGESFQTDAPFDKTSDVIITLLKRKEYTIEEYWIDSAGEEVRTRVDIAITKDSDTQSGVRVAVIDYKRKRCVLASKDEYQEPIIVITAEPVINDEATKKLAGKIKEALKS